MLDGAAIKTDPSEPPALQTPTYLHRQPISLSPPTPVVCAEYRGFDDMSQTQQMQHEDSIETQDPHNEEPKKTKSRRPASTTSLLQPFPQEPKLIAI
jgi:hypothetical protein